MEPAQRATGIGDRRNGRSVTSEDAADSVVQIRAEGNGTCLVHRGAKRADGGESVVSLRQYLQAPLAIEERALTPAREVAVEARVPRIVQVGMARDALVDGSADQFLDLSAITGEDRGPAAPKRSLERHKTRVVDGSDVGREPAEPLARHRHHGEGKHQGRR